QAIETSERESLVRRNQELARFREERMHLENKPAKEPVPPSHIPTFDPKAGGTVTPPARVPIPKSPVVSRPVEELKQHQIWQDHFGERPQNNPTNPAHGAAGNPGSPRFNFQPPPRHEHNPPPKNEHPGVRQPDKKEKGK